MDQTILQTLRNLPINGNANADQGIFNLAHQIIMGDHPLPEKIEALQKVEDAMGGGGTMTEKEVQEYILIFVNDH